MSQVLKPKKGYKKVKWLFGKEIEIPEEWEIVRLNSILQKPISYGVLVPDSDPNGVPMIRSGNIDIPNGIEKSLLLISKQLEEKYKKTRLKGGEILIALVGATIGKLSYISSIYAGYNVSRALGVLVLKKKHDPKFFEKYLKSILFQKSISIMSIGSAQPVLNLKELQQIKLILPPLPDQQKIASILSNVDNIIINTQKIIDQTKSAKKGLMQKLLTQGIGHKKFKKVKWLFGKEIEIPEKWEFAKIEKFCNKITSGGTPNRSNSEYYEGKIPWIKSGELKDNFISNSEEKITQAGLDESSAKLFPKNTVLIAMYGATIGKTAITKKESATNQAICAILPNESFDSFYLQQLLINQKNILTSFGMGAGQPNINQEIIKSFHIPLPPLPEQQKIASILSNVDSQIQSQTQHKEKLGRLKKSLMQKLLTGEVRVTI